MRPRLISLVFALGLCASYVAKADAAADPLPSWNDTAPKKAVMTFVEKATKEGASDFVPVPERIAVFDNDGTPAGIQSHIGRRPIAAFGNSDGDLQMLQWTAAGRGLRFAVIVHHDDAAREWAYDRKSRGGQLDKAWDEAVAEGWTVVSMKADWKRVFTFDTEGGR